MDLKKIFLEDSCPTKVGGQAVLEGIMMKGESKTAVAVRLPDDSIHIKTENIGEKSKWTKFPIIRGVFIFAGSLVHGTKTLMYSAEVLENYVGEDGPMYEKDKMTIWLEKRFGVKGAWDIMLYFSVFLAMLFTVGIFIIAPTALVDLAGRFVENEIVLNLIEGVLRIVLFVIYIALISKMKDIRTVFKYHGAEHKCIHCYERGLDLTVENCKPFYTLHPRCGTSFLMFVMVISLILFSLLGWPNLVFRIVSRLLLLPIIAGLSYELLRWAGRSSGTVVKMLSLPGLYLQKLTTLEPDDSQLEVAIIAMKAAMEPASTPCYEGNYVMKDGIRTYIDGKSEAAPKAESNSQPASSQGGEPELESESKAEPEPKPTANQDS